MDKTVPDNKKDVSREENAQPQIAPAADFSKTTVGAYNPELTAKKFAEKTPWNSGPQGRLAIRLFSRGIMGAAFFAAGGLLNQRLLAPGKYNSADPWSKQTNPLKIIAKLIDTGVGKPIEMTVEGVARGLGRDKTAALALANRAVSFRPTRYPDSKHPGGGHSLGEEVVAVTFDFFCASVGDAMGRDIAGLIDPNIRNNPDPKIRQKWIDKDGHVKPTEAVQSLVKSLWRYVSYNGGEDWGVAIPYVYFLRGHRAALNHFSPGFRLDSDRSGNGGSAKINTNASITGSFSQEGIVDLQNRFVVYNMGTVLYRELYDYVARKIKGKNAVLYGAPDKDTTQMSLGEKTADVFKWMARGVIKAGIYMTPAVPFFWITRTPQSKYRGTFVNPKHGALGYEYENEKHEIETRIVHANEHAHFDKKQNKHYYTADTQLGFTKFNDATNKFEKLTPINLTAGQVKLGLDSSMTYKKPRDMVDHLLNPLGHANYKAAEYMADKPAKWLDKHSGAPGRAFKNLIGQEHFSEFGRRFTHASASYTPYMYTKAEFANLWDNGKMDLASERLIDGATKLNWKEFKAGASEVWRSILHKPLLDAGREAEAERRIELDTSQSDAVNRGDADVKTATMEKKSSWRERIIHGKKPEVNASRPTGYAEQEEMRKALEELHPPTNSIN